MNIIEILKKHLGYIGLILVGIGASLGMDNIAPLFIIVGIGIVIVAAAKWIGNNY